MISPSFLGMQMTGRAAASRRIACPSAPAEYFTRVSVYGRLSQRGRCRYTVPNSIRGGVSASEAERTAPESWTRGADHDVNSKRNRAGSALLDEWTVLRMGRPGRPTAHSPGRRSQAPGPPELGFPGTHPGLNG